MPPSVGYRVVHRPVRVSMPSKITPSPWTPHLPASGCIPIRGPAASPCTAMDALLPVCASGTIGLVEPGSGPAH